MKLRGKLLAALLVLASGSVAALTAGTKVYIKAKNTKVLAKADPASAVVGKVLQPGDEVAWQKSEGKEFHQIKTSDGKTGFVYFSNLSLNPPPKEFVQGTGTVDTRGFASSGAATKALGDAAVNYGGKKLNNERAVKDVLAMEGLSAQTNASDVAAHVKVAGLVPAVGDKE